MLATSAIVIAQLFWGVYQNVIENSCPFAAEVFVAQEFGASSTKRVVQTKEGSEHPIIRSLAG